MTATPYLRVDVARLEANIAAMQAFCDDRGIALRPHAKTHKCLPIAARQLAAGAVGLTVATLGEAEVFAELPDVSLFVAYPVLLGPDNVERARELADRCELIFGADSADGIRSIAAAFGRSRPAGRSVTVRIELDCGLRRTGTDPVAAGELATLATELGLPVDGVFTFPGQGYGPGNATAAARAEAEALTAGAASLAERGLPCPVRSGGCTPTARLTDAAAVTELRPGVYALNDAQQRAMGHASDEQLAVSVISTVISTAVDGQFVLDAGSKILAADRPGYVDGHALLPDHPGARFERVWEHHGVVDASGLPAAARPAVGGQVRVVPNHVCTAVNLVDELVADHPDGRRELWPVGARGRNA